MEPIDLVFVVSALLGLGAAAFVFRRRQQKLKRPSAPELVEAARVVLDVQQRAIDSFLVAGLRGAQLRNELYRQHTRITYGLRRAPTGVEHQLSVSVEGRPPPPDDSASEKELTDLAHFAVYVTQLAKLEPAEPLEIETARRQVGATRTLTEVQTRAMRTRPVVPPELELTELWAKAGELSKSIWRKTRAAS